LTGCTKPTTPPDVYCSDSHAEKAVRYGEAIGCANCNKMPVTPGFQFCSKRCALKAGAGGGGAGAGAGAGASGSGGFMGMFGSGAPGEDNPLRLLDGQDATGVQVFQRFMERWKDPNVVPKVHAIYTISLGKKYDKRFSEALSRGEALGGFTSISTYYGGQCLCDLGANAQPAPQFCNWNGCSICIVARRGFDLLEFGNLVHDGKYGRGIYTNLYPNTVHQYTVEKSTNPFRAIIVCSVVTGTTNSQQDKKNPVVVDPATGRVFCGTKDTIIPRQVVIYQI